MPTAASNRRTAILTQGRMRHGLTAFTTTATTVQIDVADFKRITGVVALPVAAAYSANDTLFCTDTVATDATTGEKHLTLGTAKKVTIARNAGGTSGLAISYVVFGY